MYILIYLFIGLILTLVDNALQSEKDKHELSYIKQYGVAMWFIWLILIVLWPMALILYTFNTYVDRNRS